MAVKHSNEGSEIPANPKRGEPVWLSGWQLAIPSAGIAIVAALLAVPRATEPRTVPQPVIHVRALNADLEQLEAQARVAKDRPLPFAIREVGEAYRRLGRTQVEGPQLLDDRHALGWQSLVRSARAQHGDLPLLSLRAVQVQMFVQSVASWEKTGTVPDDLVELGGDFVRLCKMRGWMRAGHLDVFPEERWAIGVVRWTTLAGLQAVQPFRCSPNLEVVQLRFLYRHSSEDPSSPELRQRIVKRYFELDPEYPLEYARGVLAASQGQFELAAASFTRQLQAHPDGSYVARARNHLIWAAERARSFENGIETR